MTHMKKLLLFAVFLILFAVPVLAQQLGDPPLPVPDYNPKGWKEYSFEKDKVKFRFPVEPKPVETTSGTVTKLPGRIYQRDSFMTFSLMALEAPSGTDIESKTGLILKMRDAYLEQIKGGDPKVIKDLEITVDGHSGRFIHVETNDGMVIRIKFFVAKNRIYYMTTMVKKGETHGDNWANDFEIPAMAFLDSIHLITN